MMGESEFLEAVRAIIQEDVGRRGLANDPDDNLIQACRDDFASAAASLATTSGKVIGILTGFFIPHAEPPCGETDGPPGAVFLARALTPLGFRVVIYTDSFCMKALSAGLQAAALTDSVRLLEIPASLTDAAAEKLVREDRLSHLISVERVGPGHTTESVRLQAGDNSDLPMFLQEVPETDRDRLRNMRGIDITHLMAPGHLLVEAAIRLSIVTIGIGDGGNEIGMGKISWRTIRRNIARGGLIACRVPTTHLIVAGISNWGAFGLGFATRALRNSGDTKELLSAEAEESILRAMIEKGPLVDGVSAKQTMSVDGLPFHRYIAPLQAFQQLLGSR